MIVHAAPKLAASGLLALAWAAAITGVEAQAVKPNAAHPAPVHAPPPVKHPAPAATQVVVAPAPPTPYPPPPNADGLIMTTGDWSAFRKEVDGKLVCFATTAPKDRIPRVAAASAGMSDELLYVTNYPDRGVNGEITIKLDNPTRQGTPITAYVNGTPAPLSITGFLAYPVDLTGQKRLLALMRAGNRMVVTSTRADTNEATDIFSLLGLNDALDLIAFSCSPGKDHAHAAH
jgi:hypothetical protein